MNQLTVLCLFAHPDDESFTCGGTIAALASRGSRVALVTFTGGEASTQEGSRRLSAAALKRLRKRELQGSSRILGISKVHVLDFPDGAMKSVAPERLFRRTLEFFQRYQPQAVFTFTPDGVTNHGDHRTISSIARRAVRHWNRRRVGSPIMLCMFGFPNGRRRRARYHAVRNHRYIKLDVSPFVGKKLRAIFQHQSQTRTMERFRHLSRKQLQRFFRNEYVLKQGRVQSRSDIAFFPKPSDKTRRT